MVEVLWDVHIVIINDIVSKLDRICAIQRDKHS